MKLFNPIVSGYPTTLDIDGEQVPIETGFRYWLQVLRCLEDTDLTEGERYTSVLSILGLRERGRAAFDACMDFLTADYKTTATRRRKQERSFSWDWDAELIVASFQMQYDIDITSPDTNMHWWRFMALFRGLGEDTPIMRTIHTRTMDIPEGTSQERRDAIKKAKREVALPPLNKREQEEHARRSWDT